MSSFLYLPVLLKPGVWEQMDVGAVQTGALSLAVCPTDPAIRYLGTTGGLFKWSGAKWEQVMQTDDPTKPIPGTVWDIRLNGENCGEVYAAALDKGLWLWRVTEGKVERLDKPEDGIPPIADIVIRGKLLFAGTDGGVRLYDLNKKEWRPTSVTQLITRQSLAGKRVYVAAWTFGVKYNDECEPDECNNWTDLAAPPNLAYIRDVLGSPDGTGFWAVAATSAGVTYWNGTDWTQPKKEEGPHPNGDTFALAQTTDGATIFAAVENSGIWASDDRGKNWYELGNLVYLTRDLIVAGDTLYAVTPNNGVRQWRLPPSQPSTRGATP